jgi:tRNA (guanosine-2'-O-)-methyltransferase
VAHGATKWLSIHRYQAGTRPCLTALQERGYRIAAATLRPGGVPVQEIDLAQPLALCFGTEEEGLSDEAHDLADLFVRVPMQGFTQSFNVSVTAALFLYDLTGRLRASDYPWPLSPAEKRTLTLDWYLRSLRRGDLAARRFLRQRER